MSEKSLINAALLAASKVGARLFRNNQGVGWVGRITKISAPGHYHLKPGDVIVRAARPLHAGLVTGASDLIGWDRMGRFAAIELKTENVALTKEQAAFIAVVNAAGGVAAEVRDVAEVAGVLLKN